PLLTVSIVWNVGLWTDREPASAVYERMAGTLDSTEPPLSHHITMSSEPGEATYRFNFDGPHSVGKIHSFYGAFLIAVRAYTYIRSLGAAGIREVGENALLNANYVRARLADHFEVAYGNQTCMHEVVLSAQRQKQRHGVRAL